MSSDKELQDELEQLKKELQQWKDKYEDAVKTRKDLEEKLKALGDTTSSPTSDAVPPSSNDVAPSPAVAVEVAAPAPAQPEESAPKRPPLRPPAPGAGGGMRIPIMDRSKKELKSLDKEDILSKTYLKKLFLFQNLLPELPSEIGNFTELQVLDVKYNLLTTLPDAICKCTALTDLLLVGNRISSLPKDFNALTNLTKIDLSENKLKQFPEEILTLTALKDINLERNNLKTLLQEGLENLACLEKFNISDNELISLPVGIGSFGYLQELLLSDNQLSILPAEIGHLAYLVNLQLNNNQLTSLPDDIAYLTTLSKLGLKNNKLSTLPETVAVDEEKGWYSLTSLNLARNAFEAMPEVLWTMEALQELNFTSNKLKEVPADIEHSYSLKTLLLGDNKIAELPPQIVNLAELDTLHVFMNELTALPADLGNLFNLRVLFAGYNKIKEIPDLSSMGNLEQLFLSSNPLGDEGLHKSVWSIGTLQQLYLHNVGISTIPDDIENLTSLIILDVSRNNLSALPNKISLCECLSRLNAAHNNLSTLPEDTYELRELILLDLSHNKFEQLPEFVKYIKERVEIIVNNNPLPAEVIKDLDPHKWDQSTRFPYDAAEMLGRRPTMEDAFMLCGQFQGKKDVDLFGLFDGHAGRIAATFSGEHIPTILASHLSEGMEPLQAIAKSYADINVQFEKFLSTADASNRHAGCTGVVVLIIDRVLYLGNVGDSRVVLNRGGRAVRISFDHKPNLEEEEERIRKLGGYIIGETHRVNGLLAISRAIGDFYMHPFVIVEPYLNKIELTDEDEYITIACDGVWDEVEDQQSIDILKGETDPFIMASKLRDYSYLVGSDDNISAVVILLNKK